MTYSGSQPTGDNGRHEPGITRISPQAPRPGRDRRAGPARPVRDAGLPGTVGWPDPAHEPGPVEFLPRPRWPAENLELGRVPRPAQPGRDRRHPLRHEVVQARYVLAGRVPGHAAGPGGTRRAIRAGALRRGLHDQPAGCGPDWRQGVGGLRVRGKTARARARRSRPAPRPPPLLLEERQVAAQPGVARPQRPGLLGELRLPHLRRPMAGTALRGRLTWQVAKVRTIADETPSVRTITLDVPDWPGHQAGQ